MEDDRLKMYEAQAITIEKEREIRKLVEEIERLNDGENFWIFF